MTKAPPRPAWNLIFLITPPHPHPPLRAKSGHASFSAMSSLPTEFPNVTALTKANIYFDGKVVSHSLVLLDGSKKTLGLIYPGTYHFGTDKAELMQIVAGACTVKLDGASATADYSGGQAFEVPAKSGFDITVNAGICEYICSFID
jgi:uncharacterized protein YaiE (UPF0345 family)